MLWELLGSEHGCLLSSKITTVMWHQLRLLFLQLRELNQEHPHGWLQFVPVCAQKLCLSGLSMAQNCVPEHPDLQWVCLWPHTEYRLGTARPPAPLSSVLGGAQGDWLKATRTFWRLPAASTGGEGGENWAVPTSLLFLAGISVQLGRQTGSSEHWA